MRHASREPITRKPPKRSSMKSRRSLGFLENTRRRGVLVSENRAKAASESPAAHRDPLIALAERNWTEEVIRDGSGVGKPAAYLNDHGT